MSKLRRPVGLRHSSFALRHSFVIPHELALSAVEGIFDILSSFLIRASTFFRHSSFRLRHLLKLTPPALILLLFSFLLLSGCRTTDTPGSGGEFWSPPDWAREEQASDPVWQSLSTRQIDTSSPLNLAALVAVALDHNPAIRQAWENARVQAYQTAQSRSQWYPSVALGAEASYQKQDFNLKDSSSSTVSPDQDELTYGPSLKITWLVLDLGGRSSEIEEALQNLLAANYSYNRTLQDLILEVENAYYDFYGSRSGLEAARADVKDAETSLDAARRRLKAGLGTKLDELQTRATYEDSLASLEAARGTAQTSKANLARAIGLPASTELKISDPAAEPPIEITAPEIGRLMEETLRARPDLAALRARVRAADAAVNASASSLWPELNVGGTAGKNWYTYYGENEPYDDSYGYTGYVSLGWEIFNGFYDLNRKRAAEARAGAAREELAGAELEASADVWSKYYAYDSAAGKYRYSKAFFQTAQSSYDLALESYNAGLTSILDLLQSQSQLAAARNQLILSKKDVFISLAELAHTTGTLGREKGK